MNERNLEVLEQYDLEVRDVRRGRGAFLCETSQGLKLLKEYRGTVRRLEFEDEVLGFLKQEKRLSLEQYQKTSEGALVSIAPDGTKYILKDWFPDREYRECDLRSEKDVRRAVRGLALLHKKLREMEWKQEWQSLGSIMAKPLSEEMVRHNRELLRVRKFIRNKKKKTEFEFCVIRNFHMFFEQAEEAARGLQAVRREEPMYLCHGDMNQHHILICDEFYDEKYNRMRESAQSEKQNKLYAEAQNGSHNGSQSKFYAEAQNGIYEEERKEVCGDSEGAGLVFTEFNQMHQGVQVEDLYRLMRKTLEKQGWHSSLGMELLGEYDAVLPLSRQDRESLYYLFLYPEKYWKQMNFYLNNNKAWIPMKNIEKLMKLEEQFQERDEFLQKIHEKIERF